MAVKKRTKTVASKAADSRGNSRSGPRMQKGTLVSSFMTRSPHTIGRDQTLAHAHELMNRHRIRHLPVLDGGRLVGLVSQRDLYFVESLDSTAPARIAVDEAMSQDVFETAADTPLAQVVQTMIRKKHGSAVVTDRGKVVGVFSTIDGLRALLDLLPR